MNFQTLSTNRENANRLFGLFIGSVTSRETVKSSRFLVCRANYNDRKHSKITERSSCPSRNHSGIR